MALLNAAEQDRHLLNGGAARSCIAVCDGAESENAGIDKGILSATPSVNAIAIETRFVNAIMLNSISRGADIGSHFTNTTKLHFRNGLTDRYQRLLLIGVGSRRRSAS